MHIVLKGNDGFQKEEEREFESIQAPYTYRMRQYQRLENPFIYRPFQEYLGVVDREFYLKSQFYALGKQIAYYEEI
jgi:hypothetical protein